MIFKRKERKRKKFKKEKERKEKAPPKKNKRSRFKRSIYSIQALVYCKCWLSILRYATRRLID
jgi:hypothetical protein